MLPSTLESPCIRISGNIGSSRDGGAVSLFVDRIHDYHNYPSRDVFLHPCLDSPVEHLILDTQRIVVNVGRIHNPRAPNNISGTLSLELWALPEPYAGGDFSGHPLAAITLGSLAGGESWQDCTYELGITPPATGTSTLTLMLREWANNGYVTRDHYNLADAVTFPLATAATCASETVIADTALDQVPNPPQSLEQESGATAMEPASGARRGRDASSPVLKDIEDVRLAAGARGNVFTPFKDTKPGTFVRRLLEKLKYRPGL